MRNLLKKYWGLCLGVIMLPPAINWIVGFNTPCFFSIVGEAKDWLNFFAVYFSSIITAFVSFFILYKTIENNVKENNTNRNLQLAIFDYQQNQDWLKEFRIAAAQYVALYSYNDLVDVANIARNDPYKAFYLIKELFTRAGNADLRLSFIQRKTPSFMKLNDYKTTLFIFYNQVLYDIQSLLTLKIENPTQTLESGFFSIGDISDDMKNIIEKVLREYSEDSIENQFNTIIMKRIKPVEKCEEKLRDWLCVYINSEQENINSILIKNDKEF